MIGEVIGGRYELRDRLGSGGMADVYTAYDRRLDRVVALKVLREGLNTDRNFVARFTREARAAASITHPRVVGVLDAGSARGRHFSAMELIPGGTVKEALNRDGPFPERRALRVARDIGDGVAAAHERGVIHRDLKPQNVLLDNTGRPKVADFGIARTTGGGDLTQTAAVLGSINYLSPEQAAGGPADERSDVYSIGVVLYEMLTGFVPFRGGSPLEIATQHARVDPVPPRRIRAAIDPATDRLVLRAMAKRPEERFASAAALRDAIDGVLGDGPAMAAPPRLTRVTRTTASRSHGARGDRRALGLITAIAVLAAGGAIIGARAVADSVGPARPLPTVAGFALSPAPTPLPQGTPSPAAATSAPRAPTTEPSTDLPAAAAVAPTVTSVPPVSVAAGDPAATVNSFYQLVSARRYADAASLWSARMQASYPPATNIDQRFVDTRSINADSAVVTSRGLNQASVSVYLTEVTSAGTRHFSGTWYLVRSGSVWLMDAPQLGPA